MPREGGADALDHRLADACLRLDIQVRAADRERLLAYLHLIERWNKVYNLTAHHSVDQMFMHHLLDCLAIVPPLDRWLAERDEPPRVLDVGSGAGLPGAVLAILRPAWRVTCIDAVAKKAAFIRQVAAELGLANLEAVHGRVEAPTAGSPRRFDLVVSRAFASLHDFVELTRAALAQGGAWAAMKAAPSEQEIAGIPADVEMFHVEHLAVPDLEAQRCLIWLRPRPVDSPATADHRQ